MKVIAFTGMPGAGKTEAVAVARELGIPVVSMGDEVRKETERRGLPLTDEHVGRVAEEMRKTHGMDVWARRCLARIEGDNVVIVDGIRNHEEVELFRNNIPDFILVAVHASPARRYERLMARRREDDSMSVEELKVREKRELAWGLGDVIAMADIVVVNEGSLETFREKIKEMLSQFLT